MPKGLIYFVVLTALANNCWAQSSALDSDKEFIDMIKTSTKDTIIITGKILFVAIEDACIKDIAPVSHHFSNDTARLLLIKYQTERKGERNAIVVKGYLKKNGKINKLYKFILLRIQYQSPWVCENPEERNILKEDPYIKYWLLDFLP